MQYLLNNEPTYTKSMVNLSKILAFSIVILLFACVSIVGSAFCAITKLPPPKFTVTFTDNSYNIQPHTTIDPYTGKIIENP